MKPVDQPAGVEARFDADGSITPLSFTEAGRRHMVTSVGRSWDVAGEGRHVLVMDERGRVVELLLRVPALTWRVVAVADVREASA